MKAIENVLEMIKQARGNKADRLDKEKLQELRSLGQSIIESAYNSKETNDDRGNQHDAYAYAIFLDGKELERHYLDPTISMANSRPYKSGGIPNGISGREAADSFISSYRAPKGLTLLVCNGMFYSYLQEHGLVPNVLDRFNILSQEVGKLDAYASDNKGNVQLIGI